MVVTTRSQSRKRPIHDRDGGDGTHENSDGDLRANNGSRDAKGRASLPGVKPKRSRTVDKVLPSSLREKNLFPSEDSKRWDGPFLFAQLADTQLGCLTGDKSLDTEIHIVRQGVERINKLRPKFVIVCGDMINAFPDNAKKQDEQIEAFYKEMRKIHKDIPLVCVCGNHDVGNQPNRASIERYKKKFGTDFFTFWVGGVKCIVINSSLYKDDSKAKSLAKRHHQWFMKELKRCEAENPRHTLVFAHIPPFINTPNEPDGYFNWTKSTRRKVLSRMKKAAVCTMFCGHYHRNAGGRDGALEVVVTSALGCALKALEDPLGLPVSFDEPTIGTQVSGFRMVYVGEKRVRHKWFVLDKIPSDVSLMKELLADSEGGEKVLDSTQ
mmetsp:Transcript_10769/g.14983  ORF Transcript_10769/g.14983 Transcript_10769/m.14983 type:complete len:381 (-) Transcript_10769:2-1144(-)